MTRVRNLEREALILDAIKNGKRYVDIAKIFNIGVGTISLIVSRYEIKPKHSHKKAVQLSTP